MTHRNTSHSLLALVPDTEVRTVARAGSEAGVNVSAASSLGDLFERLGEEPWMAVLVSFSIEGVDEAVLRRLAETSDRASLLLCSRGASLEQAMILERTGAVALLREPLDPELLLLELGAVAMEPEAVVSFSLSEISVDESEPPTIVGSSAEVARIFETVARVAGTDATVLITGESGTGKELVARALHWASPRRDEPFVPVNCAAIPENLLESELFGHEKGAFSGAVARKKGRFERAHGGTLFLDEIGDMSLTLQAKILRALEDREIERVGGEERLSLDLRLVAATHRSLSDAMESDRFREDLYYRLAVVELHLPPLRERRSDIRELCEHFALHRSRRHGKPLEGISEEALRRLEAYDWPGNIRELRNVVDRAVLLASGTVLRSRDLRLGSASPRLSPRSDPRPGGYPPTLSLQEVESEHIRQVLRHTGGHMGDTADILGIHRNTLTRKVREYGLDVPETAPDR